jgi:hypothetical protein
MAPVSPEAETVDSAAIEEAANRSSARGSVLMHLKKVLRSKAAVSPSPAADEQIHVPADGSGSTSSSAVALSVRLLVLQHLKNVLRSMRRSVSPVAAGATGTPVADEPTVDAVVGPPTAEVPMVTAPMIAPDQFERDIADIVAARDALDAETPAALALAELKRQFARTWSRVFH